MIRLRRYFSHRDTEILEHGAKYCFHEINKLVYVEIAVGDDMKKGQSRVKKG
jgi:hypothetical protein